MAAVPRHAGNGSSHYKKSQPCHCSEHTTTKETRRVPLPRPLLTGRRALATAAEEGTAARAAPSTAGSGELATEEEASPTAQLKDGGTSACFSSTAAALGEASREVEAESEAPPAPRTASGIT